MCLIVFSWKQHSEHALVLAANRDEFHERPTRAAQFWRQAPELLAGRDLRAGGTWMGVTRDGRFAAVTNYREPVAPPPGALSRGELVSDYLLNGEDPERWLETLLARANRYGGFNLLLGTPEQLIYFSNRGRGPETLRPGVYGLSNHLIDTPWPKVVRARRALAERVADGRVAPGDLMEIMTDRARPPDQELPDTGVGIELERVLGPVFVDKPGYGTRCITTLTLDRDQGVSFVERSTAPVLNGTLSYRFALRGR